MTDETHPLEAFGYTTEGEGSAASGAWANAPTVVLACEGQVITVQLRGTGGTAREWDATTRAMWEGLKETGGGASFQDQGVTVAYWQTGVDTIEQVQVIPPRQGATGSIRFLKKPQKPKGLMGRLAASAERERDRRMPQRIEFAADQEEAIRAIQQAIGFGSPSTCPACGKPVQGDAAFCPNCGHKLSAAQAAALSQCKNCGASLDPTAKFCAKCGTRVEK